jgi:hypothetical protein
MGVTFIYASISPVKHNTVFLTTGHFPKNSLVKTPTTAATPVLLCIANLYCPGMPKGYIDKNRA